MIISNKTIYPRVTTNKNRQIAYKLFISRQYPNIKATASPIRRGVNKFKSFSNNLSKLVRDDGETYIIVSTYRDDGVNQNGFISSYEGVIPMIHTLITDGNHEWDLAIFKAIKGKDVSIRYVDTLGVHECITIDPDGTVFIIPYMYNKYSRKWVVKDI